MIPNEPAESAESTGSIEPIEPIELADDIVLLVEACSVWMGQRVLEAARDSVDASIRFGDGYVFQHLLQRPMRVTELAHRLGVTQQAASKQVADLVARGLVERRDDPTDRRATLVQLSRTGLDAVDAGRRARIELAAAIEDAIGVRASAELRRHLRKLARATGALDHLADRRHRPESGR